MSEKTPVLSAYEVSVAGYEFRQIVNSTSRGKAKATYFRDVHDTWSSIAFTSIRCRKVGEPRTPAGFDRVAQMRGVSFKVGDWIETDGIAGFIVGHNDSANFDVLAENGTVYNVHPLSIRGSAR